MKKYGSKDIMRMESIKDKSLGDYMTQLNYAFNMASAITEPGKAMARGYASQELFGEQAAIAYVFFERAFDLGGKDVKPMASVNAFDDPDSEYASIPMEERPATRKDNIKVLKGEIRRKTGVSNIVALGKVNVIKGTGTKFNLYDYPNGTIEVWKPPTGVTYRLVYTSHYESIYYINEKRTFKFDDKIQTWTMIDYIESKYISNLAPLYGKSIAIFCYD